MIDYDKPQFEVCANCKYWDFYDRDKLDEDLLQEAECHRYPPNNPNIADVTEYGVIFEETHNTPLLSHCFTFGTDWCGEFVPNRNPPFPDGVYMP